MAKTIISNELLLQKKISKLKEDGTNNLHVVSDFDKTLTTAFVDGKKATSSFILIRESNFAPGYREAEFALFDKYFLWYHI